MSEAVYALLLRLYPASFRQAYGDEAMQLYRDRARDERGFTAGVQLWLDLLGDLVISLPREYRSASAAVAQPRPAWDGTPSFLSLEAEPISPRSLLYGGIAALSVYGVLLVLIAHGGRPLPSIADFDRAPRYAESAGKPLPDVVVTSLPEHPLPGSTVRLTAKVHSLGGPPATGHVRFFDGEAPLHFGTLDDGAVTVRVKLSRSATHTFSAIYYGDVHYSSAASAEKTR